MTEIIKTQEQMQVDSIIHILQLVDELYDKVHTKVNDNKLNTTIKSAYETKVRAIQNDPRKTRMEESIKRHTDEFLWKMLIERFEMLNSVVNTYFALICNTRKAHNSIVKKFMKYAIRSCVWPIFRCKEPIKEESIGSDADTKINNCLDFYKKASASFEKNMDVFFSDTNTANFLKKVSESEHSENRNAVSESIGKFGPDNFQLIDKKQDSSSLLKNIENSFDTIFKGCGIHELTGIASKENKDTLKVVRDESGENLKAQVFKIIKGVISHEKDARTVAKVIAYYKIFYNSAAFGFFHFKNFDKNTLIKYCQMAHNPLFTDFGSDGMAGEIKTGIINNYQKVKYPSKGWNGYEKQNQTREGKSRRKYTFQFTSFKDISSVQTLLTPVLENLELRSDYSSVKHRTTQRPKSAPPPRTKTPAKAASKKNRPASAIAKKGKATPVTTSTPKVIPKKKAKGK
jgi:hypothetical protein